MITHTSAFVASLVFILLIFQGNGFPSRIEREYNNTALNYNKCTIFSAADKARPGLSSLPCLISRAQLHDHDEKNVRIARLVENAKPSSISAFLKYSLAPSEALETFTLVSPGYYAALAVLHMLSENDSRTQVELSHFLHHPPLEPEAYKATQQHLARLGVASSTVFYRPTVIFGASPPELIERLGRAETALVEDLDALTAWTAARLAATSLPAPAFDADAHIVLNVLRFAFPWLHAFGRDALARAHTFHAEETGPQSTHFFTCADPQQTVTRPGSYFAVQLGFRAAGIPDTVLYEAYDRFLETADPAALADVQHRGLVAYLIGRAERGRELPELSAALLAEIRAGLAQAAPRSMVLGIPAFRQTAASQLRIEGFPALLRTSNTDFPMLSPVTQVAVLQSAYLCVDESGIEGGSATTATLIPRSFLKSYFFDQEFYFLLVLKDTGVPLVASKVKEVLKGMDNCKTEK